MHPSHISSLADQVRRGLTDPVQKWLPASALYDAVGSALFDAITVLPEYGLTRADVRLLTTHAGSIAALTHAHTVVELGSGSGVKTRQLLAGFPDGVTYCPVDVSRAALDRCVAELAGFHVRPVQDEFLPGLRTALENRDGSPALVAFLGSNIGNFQRDEIAGFFRDIRDAVRPGDFFLVGADLVKPAGQLVLAYDDPAGVTAAFNRNLLARLNREFGGNFDLRSFEHEARWNAGERRIEMHLRAYCQQSVSLPRLKLDITFGDGETIWTESSHKFEAAELKSAAGSAGFDAVAAWTDEVWPFAELLFRAV